MALPESHNVLDVSQLSSLRQSVAAGAAGSHHKVAQQFEGLFLSMMLKNMRQAMASGGALDNNETKMATEMFDNQLAQNLASGRGIGLASALEKQLDRGKVTPDANTGTTPIPLNAQKPGLPLASPHGFPLTRPTDAPSGLPLSSPSRSYMIAPSAAPSSGGASVLSLGGASLSSAATPSLTPLASLVAATSVSSAGTTLLILGAPDVPDDSEIALSASIGGAPVSLPTESAAKSTGWFAGVPQQVLDAALTFAGGPGAVAALGASALASYVQGSGTDANSASAGGTVQAASGAASSASSVHDDFVQRFKDAALSAAEATGIPAKVILGQAALESGWGKHEARGTHGQSSYNLFGIKADSSWTGKTVESPTTEYVNGVAHKVVQKFRAYASYAESFMDYAKTVATSPRYARAMNQSHDATSFASAIGRSGYATDPHYAQKLVAVINGPLKHVA